MRGKAATARALNQLPQLFVVDAFAVADPQHRFKVRVVCSRPYHALFVTNMFLRPTPAEMAGFGEPDFTILNAGIFPSCRAITPSGTAICLDCKRQELCILGTEYAGEMKKGFLSFAMYALTQRGALVLHSALNVDKDTGSPCLFLGLSGTGKTSLSASATTHLVGDDEHVWAADGHSAACIEGGCYGKTEHLSAEKEPELFAAIRFGAIVENVKFDTATRTADYNDVSETSNGRVAYPISFIPRAILSGRSSRPRHMIFLTCDAFGLLPTIACLTHVQAVYCFLSGYSCKIPHTETGVLTPTPVFSACFGEPFLTCPPTRYAHLLAQRLAEEPARPTTVFLVNTGWVGGGFKTGGRRVPIEYTRQAITAIQAGELDHVKTRPLPLFGWEVPLAVPGVPAQCLDPRSTWKSAAQYDVELRTLGHAFGSNFQRFLAEGDELMDIVRVMGGPALSSVGKAAL